MGKRGRRRDGEVAKPVRPAWQTARVRIDDATWAEYRQSLGERSVAEELGAHVEGEVAQWRRRRASRAELDERELVELLERIEATRATLESLAARLERRLPARPAR
jgi:hypothetical protein